MCGLCGVLGGGEHWTDTSSSPGAFAGRADITRRRERQDRTRLANKVLKHYGLSLADWAAASYVLKSGTGRTVLVDNLSQLWAAAEELGKRPCDPLDAALLDALEGGRGGGGNGDR